MQLIGPECDAPWSEERLHALVSVELQPFAELAATGRPLRLEGECASSLQVVYRGSAHTVELADVDPSTRERVVAMVAARLVEDDARARSDDIHSVPIAAPDPGTEGAAGLGVPVSSPGEHDALAEERAGDVQAARRGEGRDAERGAEPGDAIEARQRGEVAGRDVLAADSEAGPSDETGARPRGELALADSLEALFLVTSAGHPAYGAALGYTRVLRAPLELHVGGSAAFGSRTALEGVVATRWLAARLGLGVSRAFGRLRLQARALLEVGLLSMSATAATGFVAESRSRVGVSFPVEIGIGLYLGRGFGLVLRGGASFVARGLRAQDVRGEESLVRWTGAMPLGEVGVSYRF